MGTYGYLWFHTDLVVWGVPVGLERVRSVMRELGLQPVAEPEAVAAQPHQG